MKVLVALGGNAMTNAEGRARPEDQIAAAETAMEAVADLVAAGVEVVVTHGNGPQVGNLLVKNELAAAVVPPVPLDWCGAQTQGTLGFVLMDALDASLARRGVDRRCAAVVTRTRVDADDAGFDTPTKPIGRFLPAEEARHLIEHGETWEDRGDKGWRRVVASPEPLEVIDAPAVRALVEAGFVVIANGGGGIRGGGRERVSRSLGRFACGRSTPPLPTGVHRGMHTAGGMPRLRWPTAPPLRTPPLSQLCRRTPAAQRLPPRGAAGRRSRSCL
jgi:carbamate kinase